MLKILPYIRNSKLFYGMADEEMVRLLGCLGAKVRRYQEGDLVWRSGERVRMVGVVLKGRLHLMDYDLMGNKSLVTEYVDGQSFGEEYAFSRERTLLFDLEAQEDTAVLFFNIERVAAPCEQNCRAHHKLNENMLSSLADHVYDLGMKVSHISRRTTRQKLLSYLHEQARMTHTNRFTIPFNRQELADFLAVERSAMSKELAKMKQEGLLDYRHNQFILNVAVEESIL